MVVQARPAPSTELAVHPIAAIFPMMTDEELDDLAADIKEKGQQVPIVLGADGVLLDGRNRLEGCRRAGVEPRFETRADLNTPEAIVAYVISMNAQRRHLSKGQIAMGVVVANAKAGFNETLNATGARVGTSHQRIHLAKVVLHYAPELGDLVLANLEHLDAAYAKALERKRDRDSTEERAAQAAAELASLREVAPDLADLVVEGRLSLPDANGAYRERQREARAERERFTRSLTSAMKSIDALLRLDVPDHSALYDAAFNNDQENDFYRALWTADGIRDLAGLLEQFAADVDTFRRGVLR